MTVPISQRPMSNGDIRYSVPVRVGTSPAVPALLDTGSTGLRIMRGQIFNGSYTDTGFSSLSEFGGGDRLTGTIGTAMVSVGDGVTDDEVPFQIVAQAGCAAFRPNCAAAAVAAGEYGIGGDGIAGQGFQAILGVSLQTAFGAAYTLNPLTHIGARRWIIELPEPGQAGDGTLVLNPDAQDLQGFRMFQLAAMPGDNAAAGQAAHDTGWVDTLPGCLNNAADDQSICGPAILDTGSPGIIADVPNAPPAPLWGQNNNVTMSFAGAGGGDISLPFIADSAPGTGMLEEPSAGSSSKLLAGFLPFFYYDVLYDAAGGMIGLRPRGDAPVDDPASLTQANASTEIQVIQMNAPRAAAPAGAASAGAAPAAAMPVVITPSQ